MSPRGQPTGLIDVDPSLPFDPKSLTFTDSQGRMHPSADAGFRGAPVRPARLPSRAGETYEVGVNSCSNVPNQNFKVTFEDIIVSSLRDDDGDGRYTGTFIYNPIVHARPVGCRCRQHLPLQCDQRRP